MMPGTGSGAIDVLVVDDDPDIRERSLGTCDHLLKPFALRQFEVLLERVTARIALEGENRHLVRMIDGRITDQPVNASRVKAIERRLPAARGAGCGSRAASLVAV